MSDVNAERSKLTGVLESMEKKLETRDTEVQRLKTEASCYHC